MKGCRPITDDEARALSLLLGPRDRLFVLTGLTYGLRVSEALQLDFEALRTNHFNVHSLKDSENVTFPVPKSIHDAVADVKKYYEQCGFVVTNKTALFLNYKGQRLSRVGAWGALKKACKILNMEGKVATHSLRKSMVTKIYQMTGKDIVQTQRYSRHKSLGNLQYYIATTESTELVSELQWT